MRLHYLDNLKVFLIVLVIFHHAGQAYGDGGGWAYHPSNPEEVMPWIWHFFSTNAAFFMGLYFLISGYFVPTSFDKQGVVRFVWKKSLRLGVPLLLIGALFSSLSGKFEIGHMWFVEILLFFCLVYAVIRLIVKPISRERPSKPTLLGLLLVGVLMGIGSHFIRQVSPQDHWINFMGLIFEPAHSLQYVMMFVLGILARRMGWIEAMDCRTSLMAFIIGIALAIGNYLVDDHAWGHFVWQWFGIYESLLCIFISTGLLWLFRAFCNKSSRFLKWCSAQSYGAYVFHLPLMLILQHATDSLWMGAFGKFMFIGIVITIVSFVFTWLVRLIPGIKKIL